MKKKDNRGRKPHQRKAGTEWIVDRSGARFVPRAATTRTTRRESFERAHNLSPLPRTHENVYRDRWNNDRGRPMLPNFQQRSWTISRSKSKSRAKFRVSRRSRGWACFDACRMGRLEGRTKPVQLPTRDEASLEGRWWKEPSRSRQKRVEEGVSTFRNQRECRESLRSIRLRLLKHRSLNFDRTNRNPFRNSARFAYRGDDWFIIPVNCSTGVYIGEKGKLFHVKWGNKNGEET